MNDSEVFWIMQRARNVLPADVYAQLEAALSAGPKSSADQSGEPDGEVGIPVSATPSEERVREVGPANGSGSGDEPDSALAVRGRTDGGREATEGAGVPERPGHIARSSGLVLTETEMRWAHGDK